jgi:hypothetical protein
MNMEKREKEEYNKLINKLIDNELSTKEKIFDIFL